MVPVASISLYNITPLLLDFYLNLFHTIIIKIINASFSMAPGKIFNIHKQRHNRLAQTQYEYWSCAGIEPGTEKK